MTLPTYFTGTIQTKAYRLLREHVYGVLSQYDLTPAHWSMLGVILQAQDGVRQAEIARAINLKPPVITVMTRDLQRRGIIQSVPNQFDGRSKLLAISSEGKKLVKTIELALRKRLDTLLFGLTEKDLLVYHKVLTTIIENDENIQRQK